ncbi:MAG: zinc ribbon domain-containing protein [Lachnospiraceae bacterium]|nr:zinc ribbon domain-containing protein [Lachnospiraceae bacterium]
MAIIKCPNCGEQISDKAKNCVHCGVSFVWKENKFCSECGTELEEGATACKKCGCPVEPMGNNNLAQPPQQVEVTGVKFNKKIKIIIIAVIALLVLATAVTIGVGFYKKKKAAKETARHSQEYSENLELAIVTILSGASDAEECGNLIKKVWYNAIYKERDSSTDRYTTKNGVFVSDFNDALANLFADSVFSSKIKGIEKNQKTVKELMKELKNPTEEYRDAYEALTEFYSAYLTFTNLVSDPSGSLKTFSEKFNDADAETLKCYKAMELYMED